MSRLLRVSTFALAVLFASQAMAKSPINFISFRKSKNVAKQSHLLTDDNGPWMIFVAAFAGGGAEEEARQLVDTLRKQFRVKAYLHKKHYDYSDKVEGKGFDKYGNRKRMRYQTGYEFDEIAVLVGDFESVDDPKLQKILKSIKYASAEQLSMRGKQTATTRRFAGIRDSMKRFSKSDEKRRKGPLGNAFATRNPMIPKEAIAPLGLDKAVVRMNKGVKYSLLENPGKYSVCVARFKGQVVIDQREIHEIQTKQRETDGRIDKTDEKAEELCRLLRAENFEAYVYHDVHESIVTVGSFDEIGKKLPDGTTDLYPPVAKIMQDFGPTKESLPGAGNALAGIKPNGIVDGRTNKRYMFDIAPRPILVPRRSIATDYLAPFRR